MATVSDILREAAPVLAVVLPSIAAYFMYRRSEANREKELKQATTVPPLMQVSAYAAEHAPRLIADAIGSLTAAHIAHSEGLLKILRAQGETQEKTERHLGEMERCLALLARCFREQQDMRGRQERGGI